MAMARLEFFDEVQVLAGQRRNDDAHRLREDHEPEHLALGQAERARRLELPAAHRLDPAAHHLADEGRGVQHEPGEERRELRRQPQAAARS